MVNLESAPFHRWIPYIVRTKDLEEWEIGEINPFITPDDDDKKMIYPERLTEEEKDFLRKTVGISQNEDDILRAREILLKRGVEETEKRAEAFLEEAKKSLSLLPDSPWKELLEAWRSFMLHREM